MFSRIRGAACRKFGTITVVSNDVEETVPSLYVDLSRWLVEWNDWYIENAIAAPEDCVLLYSRSLTLSGWEKATAECLVALGKTCDKVGLPLSLMTTIGKLEEQNLTSIIGQFSTLNQHLP